MSNKSVVVLAPNGRRLNVKVTPNSTILQILEEVCLKQGFKAEEYDLKHHSKVLDATSIIRYTGLPNNAQLEMVTALKTRSETQVKVGLALESGSRVVGSFNPLDSLWHVVKTLCPEEAEIEESSDILPVIFYFGREECGIENLKSTPLRSLGLTSGGAILRFFKKTPNELHHQANVSGCLRKQGSLNEVTDKPTFSALSPSEPIGFEVSRKEDKDILQPSFSEVNNEIRKEKLLVTEANDEVHTGKLLQNEILSQPPALQVGVVNDAKESIHQATPGTSTNEQRYHGEDMDMDFDYSSESVTPSSSIQSTPTASDEKSSKIHGPEETIIFLGERNAVLFDLATANACKPEDIPDDFFDLTVDDAKQILRDLKRRQALLEERPLVTSQYRELEKSKQMLSALRHYKYCTIKIQFPNQLVLQGTFKPLEKVSHVIEFVRKYLEDPTMNFYLFTTPPKEILATDVTLYDARCVPGALVYFATKCPANGPFIREDIMSKVSSVAAVTSLLSGNVPASTSVPRQQSNVNLIDSNLSSNVHESASAHSKTVEKKVPKWFKLTK